MTSSRLRPGARVAPLLVLVGASAAAADTFLGPIPVQHVARGDELVLDLHRFYEPEGQPKLTIKSASSVQAQFDPKKFQLRVKGEGRQSPNALSSIRPISSSTAQPVTAQALLGRLKRSSWS